MQFIGQIESKVKFDVNLIQINAIILLLFAGLSLRLSGDDA